jgi:hypothetical protein
VQDVVRSVDYALSRPDVDRAAVRMIGKGMGALWVLFAAALDTRISQAICEGGLLSYRTLTSSDRYLHGADIFIPDVLKYFDLPQVAAVVADRRLAIFAPVDAMRSAVDESTARQTYYRTAEAYRDRGRPDNFVVTSRCSEMKKAEQYIQFFRG